MLDVYKVELSACVVRILLSAHLRFSQGTGVPCTFNFKIMSNKLLAAASSKSPVSFAWQLPCSPNFLLFLLNKRNF